jgi:biopolymer transport protein ExbD
MHRGKPGSGSKVQLPITPMLDMTFQLLFFFLVTFHPADQEGQLDMALPAEQRGPVPELRGGEDDFPSEVTVRVRAQPGGGDGEISALFVRDAAGREEAVEGLDGLRRHLERKREGLTQRDAVQVEADPRLRVRHLARVMDACRRAGFKNVGVKQP